MDTPLSQLLEANSQTTEDRKMTSNSKLLAAIASAGLLMGTGCLSQPASGGGPGGGGADARVGGSTPDGGDTGPGGPANAKPLFMSDVLPILAQCTGAACHSGIGNSPIKFMASDSADVTYDTIVSYDDLMIGYFDKNTAPMVHMVSPGPHYTAVFTPDHISAINGWLDAELVARTATPTPGTPDGGGGGTPPLTPGAVSKALIAEWSGCMNLEDWNNEQVATRWADKGTNEGTCLKCHVNGQSSFMATRNSELMFNTLSTNKYYMLGYFAADVTDLANAQMVINEEFLDRVGNGDFPYIEHPRFAINGEPLEALRRFYAKTMERKVAGLCDPPRILP